MRALLALMLCLAAGTAISGGKTPRELERGELANFAIGSGNPQLALRVEIVDGKLMSSMPADADVANLRAVRSGEEATPMLTVSSDLPVALKFDLYLSNDGERFVYTSSCALTPGISSFEMWQQPVREFAIGNPRIVDAGKTRCD